MQTSPTPSSQNIYLLKEYIKTLLATEIVFPGVLPRPWEHSFSQSELETIYMGLPVVIRNAHPLQDRAMLTAFEQLMEWGPANVGWFLNDYWREVVILLTIHPPVADHRSSGP